jgi:hypothetical protein
MAGSGTRGSLSGLRAGPGSLSYANSADSRDHVTHRRGQRDPSPIHIETRAGAVLSHEEWQGKRGEGSAGDRIQRHQTGDGRDPRLDSLAPPRDRLAPHEAARRGRHGPYRRYKPSKRGRDAVPAVICAARVKAERDEEASVGIHDGTLPAPALKRRRGDTSMPGGRQVLIGGGAHLTQPDVRAPVGSPPRQSLDLGGTVPFF